MNPRLSLAGNRDSAMNPRLSLAGNRELEMKRAAEPRRKPRRRQIWRKRLMHRL